MIAPELGTKEDPNFRLPKQIAIMCCVDSDIRNGNSHSKEKYAKNARKTLRICKLSLYKPFYIRFSVFSFVEMFV